MSIKAGQVHFSDANGNPQQLSTSVTVTRRTWSWSGSVGGHQGLQGEIDGCYNNNDPTIAGLTASVNCTQSTTDQLFTPITSELQSGNGYLDVTVPGDGPNGGMVYVDQTSAYMSLRTQQSRYFRTDGDAKPIQGDNAVVNGCGSYFGNLNPRNVYTVNEACTNNGGAYGNFSNCTWTHETGHLNAAISSARSSTNDVYALWEPVVALSSSDLNYVLVNQYSGANSNVLQATRNAENSMSAHYYVIWWYPPANQWTSFNYGQLC